MRYRIKLLRLEYEKSQFDSLVWGSLKLAQYSSNLLRVHGVHDEADIVSQARLSRVRVWPARL